MRAAQIKNGLVINFCEVTSYDSDYVEAPNWVNVGDSYIGGTFFPQVIVLSREDKKETRQRLLDIRKVLVDEMLFDANEVSQSRMSRVLQAMQISGTPTVKWVLADNSVSEITAEQLGRALALSASSQAAAWPIIE